MNDPDKKHSKSVHDGHRKRVKEEFSQKGLEHFSQHKVLELLLYYTVRRGDTNPLGHQLIERFGSLSGVFDAPAEMLMEVPGIGEESALLIKLIPALMRAYLDDKIAAKNKLQDWEDAKEYVRYKFLGEGTECILVICLAANGKVLFSDWLSRGSSRAVEFVPADVVRTALRIGAVKLLIAHNHPDGFCNPSSIDLRNTSVLFDELHRVGIELIDHIIVAPDGVYSMVENNMFPAFRG